MTGWSQILSSGAFSGLLHGPELLQLIIIPDRGAHDVYDHITKIDQRPVATEYAFHTQRPDTVLFGSLDDLVSQGADLAAGVTAGDDHSVSDGGEFPHVEDFDIECLEVFQRMDDDIAEFGNTWWFTCRHRVYGYGYIR